MQRAPDLKVYAHVSLLPLRLDGVGENPNPMEVGFFAVGENCCNEENKEFTCGDAGKAEATATPCLAQCKPFETCSRAQHIKHARFLQHVFEIRRSDSSANCVGAQARSGALVNDITGDYITAVTGAANS